MASDTIFIVRCELVSIHCINLYISKSDIKLRNVRYNFHKTLIYGELGNLPSVNWESDRILFGEQVREEQS